MTDRLLALAIALLARLGLLLFAVEEARSFTAVVVLAFALVTAWAPWRLLGLPGNYAQPATGGEP